MTTNNKITDFFKFTLHPNEKKPNTAFGNKQNWKKKLVASEKHNVGILCGQVNNIIGVDLDMYKWGEDHSFIKLFGADPTMFDTLTQKTPNGGYHLIFEYDVDIPQTQNEEYGIDIRSDGGYLVAAGSSINGVHYEIFNDKPVRPLPRDLKEWLLANIYTKEQKHTRKSQKGSAEFGRERR